MATDSEWDDFDYPDISLPETLTAERMLAAYQNPNELVLYWNSGYWIQVTEVDSAGRFTIPGNPKYLYFDVEPNDFIQVVNACQSPPPFDI